MIVKYFKESSWLCHFQKTVYCVWIVMTYTLMASWPQSFHTVMMIMICGRRTLFGHNLIWFAVTHLLQFCLADCGNGYVARCNFVWSGYWYVGATGYGVGMVLWVRLGMVMWWEGVYFPIVVVRTVTLWGIFTPVTTHAYIQNPHRQAVIY